MKLWKNNRTDQEYELSPEELAAKFWEWNGTEPIANLERTLRCFITEREVRGGLASVFDEGEEFSAVYAYVLDTWPAGVE